MGWEGAWEQILHQLKAWNTELDIKMRNKTTHGPNRVESKACWWECCDYVAEENKYKIGGYYTNEDGAVTCWIGEEVLGGSQGEAYLIGLESAVQFMLEDMNVDSGNINLVSNQKDIVDWIHGKVEANWESMMSALRLRRRNKINLGFPYLLKTSFDIVVGKSE
ncbi:hypothetical protein PIB30_006829 [Stylosanthes scabra]|uniref:RNase H type-1 domain-containing protein n=1 Tax=Stylosanthes scabra TaxID=79078 RepID=A0ABU6V6H1_9FABA|nr:hypothetical protein [Stylosanthes scabra]